MVLQDQFTAKGPPNDNSGFPQSGFTTVSDGGGFQFGARMNAVRCGVVGQTQGGGIAGVLGQGRFSKVGVLGTGFGAAVGVVGASVDNTNSLFNLNVPPANFQLTDLGGGNGTGVLGTSGSGFGVHGHSASNTGVVGGSDDGFGVHGASASGVGGVFESQFGAQIRLIPHDSATPEGRLSGVGGDIVVTTAAGESGTTFSMWFCVKDGDEDSSTWQLIAGVRPFPGTILSEGSEGLDVKRVQLQLNLLAAAGLVVDGEFGPMTKQAVHVFQEAQDIDVDDAVGPITWGRLFDVI
jgi:Putative peptidoglycan binding domain